jgi:hypothetical protein
MMEWVMRKTTFRQWVLTAKITDDPVGDFIQDARHIIKMNSPIGNLTFNHACSQ